MALLDHAQMGTMQIGVHDINKRELVLTPQIERLRSDWKLSAKKLQKVVSLFESEKRDIEPFRAESVFTRKRSLFPQTWADVSTLIGCLEVAVGTIVEDSLRKKVRDFMDSGDVVQIPTSLIAKEAALAAGLGNKRPFKKGKNSAADALLLFSVEAWARKRSRSQFVFHTFNYSDFSKGKADKATPHPDLQHLFKPNTNLELQYGLGTLEQYEGIDPVDLIPTNPFDCVVCGESTPIEDATCQSCGATVDELLGAEDYLATSRAGGYLIDTPDERGDWTRVECSNCRKMTLDVEWETACSYHGQRW